MQSNSPPEAVGHPLTSIKALSELPVDALALLEQSLELEHYPAYARLIQQDEVEDAMYFLASGFVEVLLEGPRGHMMLAMLSPGDYFGEAALFVERRRSASVQTASEVSVYRLSRAQYQQILEQQPQLAALLLQGLFREHLDRLQRTSSDILSQKTHYSRLNSSAISP